MSLPDLTGLGQSDLDALLSALRVEASDIHTMLSDASTADDADLDRLAAIADEVDAVNAALAALAAKTAERADKAAALSARINPVVIEIEVPEVVEPVVAAVEVEVPAVPAPVVASTGPVAHPAPRKVVANAPKPQISADNRQVAIVAAAGIKGVRAGDPVTFEALAGPAMRRYENYPSVENLRDGQVVQVTDHLFSLKAPDRDPRLVASGHNDQDVMEFASNQSRLTPLASSKPTYKGIVAAGGWCAPAEQRFDICTLAALDGILDVPTIGMPRGSISYFRQLDYSTVATAIAAGEFTFTNAQLVVVPPVVKPCFEIPCAIPVLGTLSVVGLCLRAGLLQNKAFPELIAAWMHLALIAFAHYRNARNLAQMVAGSGAAIVMPATFGAIAQVLDALYLQAAVYRMQNGMAMDAELEVVAPWWLPTALKLDQERRQFNSDQDNDWAADLAEEHMRIQYVKDFQDTVFVAADPVTLWPTTVNFLLYAPGAWVRGTEDIISVSTLVDSTLLQTNRIQLMFFEAADVMLPWCGPSKLITANLCLSGTTGHPFGGTVTTEQFTCGD